LKLKDLRISDLNVRNRHDESEDLSDLIQSIQTNRLISKLVIRTTKDGYYEIVAGRRRYLALLQLKGNEYELDESEYVLRDDLDDKDALLLSIAENQQRLTLSPVDLNKAALMLNNKFGIRSEKELAKILNIPQARLKRVLHLSEDSHKMTPEVRAELSKPSDQALVNDSHWDVIRHVEKPEVIKDVVDYIMDKGATSKELPALIKSIEKNYVQMNEPVDPEKGASVKAGKPEDTAGTRIEYAHKGELVLEERDGAMTFKVLGKGEDEEVPIEHYLEYLRNPVKFKCYITFKLRIDPIDR